MLIGNRDTCFPDMTTDLITDSSDHPIRYETLLATRYQVVVKADKQTADLGVRCILLQSYELYCSALLLSVQNTR